MSAQENADTCRFAVLIFGLLTLIDGFVVGHLFHQGENELMFIPLGIGFFLVILTYIFIEFKNNFEHDCVCAECEDNGSKSQI